MDSGLLADLVEAVVATGGIDGVVVVRNGYMVVDSVVYPFPEDALHDVRSVTKSVVGTLIGIAVDRELLAGVEMPVVEILADHVPATVDERKAAMTVEDLLTMSAGLECRDSYLYDWEGMATMMESSDWVSHVLALPMAGEPGEEFEYCNGSSLLLSAILSEVTGRPASEFAREVLFEPLGISAFSWMESPGGVSVGFLGLWLSPADLAKVGLLYLRDGEWGGEQLVSSEWIESATTAQIDAGTASERYGYQWWVDDAGYSMALGYGGQYIFVAPDHNLVVAFVSSLQGDRTDEPEKLFNDYVLPAVTTDDPLPPNQREFERLSGVIAAARSGPEPVKPQVPATAQIVDGARYEIQPNDLDLDALEVRFTNHSAVIELETADQTMPFEIGTNGRFVYNEMAGGPPMALRGAWERDDSFVVEYYLVGELERGRWTLSFDDTGLDAELTYPNETIEEFSGTRTN